MSTQNVKPGESAPPVVAPAITAFFEALLCRDDDLCLRMIGAGLDLNLRDENDWTTLHMAASFSNIRVVERLIAAECDIDAINSQRRTPLNVATFEGNRSVCAALIAAGADVNTQDELGHSPLVRSITNEHPELCDDLIALGADTTGVVGWCRENFHTAMIPRIDAAINLRTMSLRLGGGLDPKATTPPRKRASL